MDPDTERLYEAYYVFARFFKWTPRDVDELPVALVLWLLDRIRQDETLALEMLGDRL